VRELENKIEYAVAMTGGSFIRAEDLLLSGLPSDGDVGTFDEAKEAFEKEYLRRLLNAAKGNFELAARMAKRQRSHIYYLISKYGLKPSDFR